MYYWMAVTNNDIELPIAVEMSARELGERIHMKTQTVISKERRCRMGIVTRVRGDVKIVKVETG